MYLLNQLGLEKNKSHRPHLGLIRHERTCAPLFHPPPFTSPKNCGKGEWGGPPQRKWGGVGWYTVPDLKCAFLTGRGATLGKPLPTSASG
jgi:hypothetical protein